MRHRADESAVLQDGAAAHALHDTAGRREQRGVRDGDGKARARSVVIDPRDVHGVRLHGVARDRGQDGRAAGPDRACGRGLDRRAVRRRVERAEDSEQAVALDRSDAVGGIEAADQLTGRAVPARTHIRNDGREHAAVAQRHEHAARLVRDAVAERAVAPRGRVIVRERADARHPVAQPEPELPRAVGRDGGRNRRRDLRAAAQHSHGHGVARRVHGGEKVRRGRDVPAVDAADYVTGQQPRVLGRRGLAAGRVHLGEIRHEHARRRHLHADGPAARPERRRLRRHARAQRERDRRRDGKSAQKMWLFPQKIPPLRVQYQYAGFRTK